MAQASFRLKPPPSADPQAPRVNALSVDVEDYFQVQALESRFERSCWETIPRRIETNTDRILALFERHNTKATFFTLAWIAERHPALIRRIVEQGHELASHGYAHIRADTQTAEEFRADIRKTKHILEDIGGVPVRGYRAATFSIGPGNLWAFQILAEEGYRYSSSINPVHHDNYGMPAAPRFAFYPLENDSFEEYPLSTVSFFGHNLPCAGGGYFRLLPYQLTRRAIRRVNTRDGWPFIFYFHPWEIDPDQPRPGGLPAKSRFRHYLNLNRMEDRLHRLLTDFAWDRIDRVFLEAAPASETRRKVPA